MTYLTPAFPAQVAYDFAIFGDGLSSRALQAAILATWPKILIVVVEPQETNHKRRLVFEWLTSWIAILGSQARIDRKVGLVHEVTVLQNYVRISLDTGAICRAKYVFCSVPHVSQSNPKTVAETLIGSLK